MKTVRDLLDTKGHEIRSIKPTASVFEAIKLMEKHKVGALLVLDRKKLVGILTERDYARKVILKGKSSKQTAVEEIMTHEVIYVSPDQTIEECMALMTEKRVRHLPVFENDKMVGVVSIGDVVRASITDKEFLIEQLTKYISGGQ